MTAHLPHGRPDDLTHEADHVDIPLTRIMVNLGHDNNALESGTFGAENSTFDTMRRRLGWVRMTSHLIQRALVALLPSFLQPENWTDEVLSKRKKGKKQIDIAWLSMIYSSSFRRLNSFLFRRYSWHCCPLCCLSPHHACSVLMGYPPALSLIIRPHHSTPHPPSFRLGLAAGVHILRRLGLFDIYQSNLSRTCSPLRRSSRCSGQLHGTPSPPSFHPRTLRIAHHRFMVLLGLL